MTDEEFERQYDVKRVGTGIWQVYRRSDWRVCSPRYSNPDAAIYYVKRELMQEMEEQIHKMLGGKDVVTSLYDDSSLHSGFSSPVKGNGSEEKF